MDDLSGQRMGQQGRAARIWRGEQRSDRSPAPCEQRLLSGTIYLWVHTRVALDFANHSSFRHFNLQEPHDLNSNIQSSDGCWDALLDGELYDCRLPPADY